jgi:hypothetical protein
LAQGAVALAGGKRPDHTRFNTTTTNNNESSDELMRGHFFEPTVLGNMAPSNYVFQASQSVGGGGQGVCGGGVD